MKRTLGLGVAFALIAGCSDQSIDVVPRSFDRPERIAFVCFDVSTRTPVPMEMCRQPAEGELDMSVAVHALVTQTARGEVAAVDLRSDDLIDSDLRVPGFTFVSVGEVPSAIVVDPENPSTTFVANYGSMNVQAVPTFFFRRPGSETDLVPRVALPEGPRDLTLAPPAMPGTPKRLLAVLPRRGSLMSIPVPAAMAEFMPGMEVVLAADVPPVPVPETPRAAEYEKVCPIDAELPAACRMVGAMAVGCAEPRLFDVPMGTTARPVRAVVDNLRNRILVADEALPWIHVLDATTLVEQPGIWVGVPTRDLVVTPEVPVAPGDGTFMGVPMTRYLYAIDATDGSVLVVDYGDDPATFGSVLAVDAQGVRARDRIGIEGVARSLEVITPAFPEALPCTPSAERAETLQPATLRGVFLTVALSDGTVRVVDIHDLDLFCRGGDALSCDMPNNADDAFVFIRRHRPRLADFVREGPAVQGVPSVVVGGTSVRIEADGTTEAESVPDLAVVACPPSFTPAFPPADEGEPLICVLADPWAATTEQWTVSWDGVIPGASGGLGRFDSARPTLVHAEAAFCSRGVLGSRDVPDAMLSPTAPERHLQGDQLWITGDLPLSITELQETDPLRTKCQGLIVDDGRGGRLPIAFEIFEARNVDADGRPSLVIGDQMIGPLALALAGSDTPPTLQTLTGDPLVAGDGCFEELFTYEVRSRNSYVVSGTRSGFLHRVVADTDGRCIVDEDLDVRQMGRAFGPLDPMGASTVRPFENFMVSFTIASDPPEGTDAALVFVTGEVPSKLGVDIGLLPTDLRYSDEQGVLYTVDTATLGLVRINLDPFRRTETFE